MAQTSSGSSNSSPLLDGEQTFEDLIGDICKGIDVTFAVKRGTVVVSDYESIFAEAKYLRDQGQQSVKNEDISLWQLEDGSYELEVNQYGYYNTVRVHYKNGVVTESYEDLVRVYGVIAIDYYENNIDKTTAIMKAKAYLAAHVRDFDMAVKATILHDGDIEIGDIVTIENPLTMRDEIRTKTEHRDPEYYFVKGVSVSWEGDSLITADIDLRYGAESPEQKDIPEAGTTYSNDKKAKNGGKDELATSVSSKASKDVSADVKEAAEKIVSGAGDPTTKGAMIYDWVDKHVKYKFYYNSRYSSATVLKNKRANCWDTAMLIYDLCTAVGVKCEVYHGTFRFASGKSYGHIWNKIEQNGKMVFADTGRTPQNKLGSLGGGKILSGSRMKKNY